MTVRGLLGPPCPERAGRAHGTPSRSRPCQAMCVRCGRVTARRDGDGLAWCGGDLPQPTLAAVG